MAQTKRKRRSKHRGNAAGTIEARGRTGRPPTAEERKRQAREVARAKREDTPPSWRAAAKRALLASAFMFIVLIVINKKAKNPVLGAAVFAIVALLLYIPAGYYMELFLFRRRQARKAAGK